MSEPDWQATMLAELGISLSGLVTPDSGTSSAPTDGHPVSPPESPREPPAQPPSPARPAPDQESAARADDHRPAPAPSATRWDEPGPQPEPPSAWPAPDQEGAAPADEDRVPPGPPATRWDQPRPRPQAEPASEPSVAEPPSAQVHSAPAPPRTSPGGESAAPRPGDEAPAVQRPAWSPPTWEQPPEPPENPRDEPQMSGWPDQAHEQQEDAGPNQASAWELASQTHWGLVAKTPWGTEPPPEDEAQPPPQAWERSDAEAWRRDPGSPAGPAPAHPAPGRQPPGRPAPQDLVRRSVHGDPLMRRMSRGVRRAMGTAAAGEIRKTADVERVLNRPVPSCRHIAVTSIRGGAGKTTIAGLTGTALAQYRNDRVLAVDADSGLGSLPLRLGVRTERSLHDLAGARPRSFEETASFLGRTTDGLWVLSGTSDGQITHELDLTTFKAVAGEMSRYFAALVIDCGAGLLPELQRGILADAHAQVMVTPGTVDGALSARGALEWQARNGYQHLLTRTVIAFVTHTPHVDADLTRAAQLLSGGGMPVVHMPYDRHLATGTAVESARIGQETRAAAIRVALEAFARAIDV